ncbi:hypothetical protein NSA11_10670 [Lactobacillus taiwanensis]|uniref:hypothetical protein n=1 Tax=Lactobacillus taiwanensis TaxID=508451 RepID=UPI00214A9211|nr:hypothetical protein [Lactobacillus taiwanensis]MCR1904327.1 hypothetical protein [Lactobacillus taiwanensis]
MNKNMNDWDLFLQELNEIKKEHNLSDSKEDREKASEIFAKKYFTDDDQDAYHSIKSINKQLNPMDKDKKVQLLIALVSDDDISASDVLEVLTPKIAQLDLIAKLAAGIFDNEGE